LFNSRPFLRLFVGLATEAGAGPADVHSYRLLKAIGVALYSLQPISVPGFAYAYVEAISHRSLMPRLLLSPPGSQGVALFESLLLSLLKFLEPYLRTSALMTDGMKTLYKVC
jgi:CCR4-NOT transcription complex subunit 1